MRSGDGSAGSALSATWSRRRASGVRPSHHSAVATATVSASRSSGAAVRSASSGVSRAPAASPAAPEQSAAITGGTGAFATARGEVTVRAIDDSLVVKLER